MLALPLFFSSLAFSKHLSASMTYLWRGPDSKLDASSAFNLQGNGKWQYCEHIFGNSEGWMESVFLQATYIFIVSS